MSVLTFDVSTTVDPATPGGRLQYTITVGNISNAAVEGVTVSMLLPVGLQFHYTTDAEPNSAACAGSSICSANGQATWTLGTIAALDTRSIVVNAVVLQTVADGSTLNTSIRLGAAGINPVSLTKTTQVQMRPTAQLATGSTTYPAVPGQRLTLDLDAGQLGMIPLTGAVLQTTLASGLKVVSMSDAGTQSSPGVVTWTVGGLGVGASVHRQVEVMVDGAVTPGSILTTRSVLTYDGGLPVDAVAEYSVAVAPTPPNLVLNAAVEPSPTIPNGHLNYIITVSNRGTRALENVVVHYRVPSGQQSHYTNDSVPNSAACAGSSICAANSEQLWSVGTLAAGASTTISLGAWVQANMVGNGNLLRSVFFGQATGVSEVRSVRTVQVFDSPAAQLALSAAANPVTNSQAFTYNVDIGQIGTASLTGTSLRVTMPAGLTVGAISDGGTQGAGGEIVWSIGDVPVGGYVHRTVAVVGNGMSAPGNILSARAILTYDGGAAIDAETEYAVPVISAAQPVTFALTATPSPAVPGNRVLYTATVTNVSSRSLDGVGLFVRLPPGMQFHYTNDADPDSAACAGNSICTAGSEPYWTIGSMAAGASQIITINAQVLTSLVDGSLLSVPFYAYWAGQTAPILLSSVLPAHR